MQEKRLLFTARIPVRWGDMDSRQHVNNTTYIQYMEEARVLWFRQLGLDFSEIGPLVLQNMHTYLKAVVHPATVVVELYGGAIGRSSLVVEHRLTTLEDPDTLYGEGFCKLVWVDHQNGGSVAIPDSVRALLA
ncbi:acyl-CoA thioesterase [Pseudomonas cavernae]|uniref:Acyl-CoA thioesterase n=1 Tax=Pseudomonas cavernae TaxID=2320867 RepID=A0A385Z3U1_9PSED|nr:thioesterase family protein [Pseudomonas cavernae]AYC33160.1 acyl-CoA thioesterase [Pseudomonas cavernae]